MTVVWMIAAFLGPPFLVALAIDLYIRWPEKVTGHRPGEET